MERKNIRRILMTVNHMSQLKRLIQIHISRTTMEYNSETVLWTFHFPSNIPSLSKAADSLKLSIISSAIDEIGVKTPSKSHPSKYISHFLIPLNKTERDILDLIKHDETLTIEDIQVISGLPRDVIAYALQVLYMKNEIYKGKRINSFFYSTTPNQNPKYSGVTWTKYPNSWFSLMRNQWLTLEPDDTVFQNIISYIEL